MSVSIASDGVGGIDLEIIPRGREFGRNVASTGCRLSDRSIRWTHLRSRSSLCCKEGVESALNSTICAGDISLTRSRSCSIRLATWLRSWEALAPFAGGFMGRACILEI
jgi:hypothetical protein